MPPNFPHTLSTHFRHESSLIVDCLPHVALCCIPPAKWKIPLHSCSYQKYPETLSSLLCVNQFLPVRKFLLPESFVLFWVSVLWTFNWVAQQFVPIHYEERVGSVSTNIQNSERSHPSLSHNVYRKDLSCCLISISQSGTPLSSWAVAGGNPKGLTQNL